MQDYAKVYRRLKTTYSTERAYIEERKESIANELKQLGREKEALQSLLEIKLKFADRLGNLTFTEWRELLEILNLEITVGDSVDIEIGVPLHQAQQINDIVFTGARASFVLIRQ